MRQVYPDISAILQAKQARRLALVALSWEEKVAIIEQMRRLLPQGQWKGSLIREQRPAYGVKASQAPDAEDRPLDGPLPRKLIEVQAPPVSQTIIEERR